MNIIEKKYDQPTDMLHDTTIKFSHAEIQTVRFALGYVAERTGCTFSQALYDHMLREDY